MIDLLERISTIAVNQGMKLEEVLAIHDRLVERFEDGKKKHLEANKKAKTETENPESEIFPADREIEVRIEYVQTNPDMETYQVFAKIKMNDRWLLFCDVPDRSMAEYTKQQLLRLNEQPIALMPTFCKSTSLPHHTKPETPDRILR